MAIAYALFSLLFAGLNDLVFKRYGMNTTRSVGGFVALVGLVMAAFFLVYGAAVGSLTLDGRGLAIGCFAGLMSVSSNILLIEAMKKSGAGMGSMIFRLNLVFVAILAWLLLGESWTLWKLTGLALAVAAVVLIFRETREAGRTTAWLSLGLLGAASFLRAWMGLAYRQAGLWGVADGPFILVGGLFWIAGGLLYGLASERRLRVGRRGAGLGLLSGLLASGIVLFMKRGVNSGEAGIVIPIAQMSFLITFPAAALLLGERLTPGKWAAMALAVGAILALALSQP